MPKEFELMDRYWKASNYLAVGQIYLLDKNPLLRRPLELGDVKTRLLGHFGTTPGQNLIYVHLNRVIKEHLHFWPRPRWSSLGGTDLLGGNLY